MNRLGKTTRAAGLVTDVVRAAALIFINIRYFKLLAESRGAHHRRCESRGVNFEFKQLAEGRSAQHYCAEGRGANIGIFNYKGLRAAAPITVGLRAAALILNVYLKAESRSAQLKAAALGLILV